MSEETYNRWLDEDEFIRQASQEKINLIDKLASKVMSFGERYAIKSAEYYRQKLTDQKAANFPQLAAEHARLEIEYDALKHALSALQSTLKAERVGIN